MKQIKVIVEKNADGYVAYPLGCRGVVVGEGDSYEEALADLKSAIQFHVESFGAEVLDAARRFSKRLWRRRGSLFNGEVSR